MSVIESIQSFTSGLFRTGGSAPQPYRQVGNPNTATQRDLYDLLRALYYANDVYGELARTWRDDGEAWASIKELRMIQHAVVEAMVALVMPGTLPDALPLEFDEGNAKADAVTEQIHQVWTWSNWAQKKQVFIRQQSMLGNAFIYVASRPGPDGERADRVYFHLPEPEHVTDIDTDERGFLTYYRSDVPVRDRDDPDNPYVVTEEWWKDHDSYRRWTKPVKSYDPKNLGTPDTHGDKAMRSDFGIDFVPVVHAKALDTGDTYGMAWIIPALEKQHEVNRKATALSQQLYRHGKAKWLLQGTGGQTNGVYAPPPPIQTNAAGEVEWHGEMALTAPAGWGIVPLIPNLPFAAHMQGISDDLTHLAETDLPILNWYRLSQSGNDASGRALQTLLKPAIAQVEEARGNAETALARADAMALTIGQFAKLPGFEAATIGTYEDGSFEHQFKARPVVPGSEEEEVETLRKRAEIAGILMREAAMDAEGAMTLAGFPADQITEALKSQVIAASTGIER
jgi:hypothetical protein